MTDRTPSNDPVRAGLSAVVVLGLILAAMVLGMLAWDGQL